MNVRLFAGAAVLVLSIVGVVHADSYAVENLRWDDVTGATVTSGFSLESERKSWHFGNCREEQGEVEGYSPRISTTLCVVRSANLAFASYSDGGSQRYAAKLASDTVFHLIDNTYLPANPLLLADDTFLTLNFAAGPPQLVTIGAVHTKLIEKQIQSGPDTFRKVYAVDASQGVTVTDASGHALFAGAVAVSTNGRYAASAVYGSGIVRIDLPTKKAKLIASNRVNSQNQNIQLAISNDGSRVVVSDQDLGKSSVYMVGDACGRSDFYANSKIDQPCPSIDFSTELSNAMDKRSAYRAVIGADDTVNFYYWDSSQSLGRMAIVKPDSTKLRLQYLALGDSYSSGEGDTEKTASGGKYYRDFTDKEEDTLVRTPREKCHISTRSYPYLLAADMGLGSPATNSTTKWQSVACSGAQTYDIANSDSGYLGQGWGGKDPGRPRLQGYVDATQLQTQALSDFIPGRVQQIEFVKKYRPKVITLTMGGNDAGFGAIMDACANLTSPGTCDFATLDRRQKLKNGLLDIYDDLVETYSTVRNVTGGQSKIYVVGYPQFINGAQGAKCKNTLNLNDEERKMIYNSVEYFNNIIESAALRVGVKYLDVEDSLGNYRLCDNSKDEDKKVTAITGYMGWNGNDLQESFHPNAKGQRAMASSISQLLDGKSLSSYTWCLNSQAVCPDSAASSSAVHTPAGGYFEDGASTAVKLKKKDVAAREVQKGGSLDLKLMTGAGVPGSTFLVTLHSDPVNLGSLTFNSDGGASATVSVPESTPAGYHTLVLAGEAPGGEQVEYYQSILVVGRDQSDLDDNGTPDSQQACGVFVATANQDVDRDGIDDACDSEVIQPTETTPTNPSTPTVPTPSPSLIQKLTSFITSVLKSIITVLYKLFLC